MADTQALIDARETLQRAQEALRTAEAAHEQERRRVLLTELALVRAELAQARDRHAALQQRVHIDRDNYDNAQAKVRRRFEAIADSLGARPAIVDFLPDDPEAVKWAKRHAQLERERDKAMEERNRLPDPNETAAEANEYRGAYGLIATLEFSERNIIQALEGKGPIVRMEGGVYGVV
jgi:hypothetical protein